MSSKRYRIKLKDVLILLQHVEKAQAHPKVGHADLAYTAKDLRTELNKAIYLKKDILESALWSCNMLEEIGQWEHPEGVRFEEYIQYLQLKFNLTTSTIKPEDKS